MSDRYQYRQYRFSSAGGMGGPGLPPMVKNLLIANGMIFFLQILLNRSGIPIERLGAVSVVGVFQQGMIWQPFTYMWLHLDLMHVFFNMFALWMFGGMLESVWGPRRFLRFYLLCGVGAGVIILGWNALTGHWFSLTLGASGAVYGVLTAFSLLWPDRTIMLLFPPIPIKAIWFIPFLFLMQIAMDPRGNVSHAGHLGGVIVAAILLRDHLRGVIGTNHLRYRWHRFRMRRRLRAIQRDEEDRRRRFDGDR